MKSPRNHRIAELIQTIIARLLQKEISDPRLQSVTITGVDLSPDGKNAVVFFSLLELKSDGIHAAEKAFEKAAAFFRFQLSQLTELRYTPKLNFKYDASLMTGERIAYLLNNNTV